MTEIERSLLAQYHKQLKLVKIWRAIARRHLSRLPHRPYQFCLPYGGYDDGETDP